MGWGARWAMRTELLTLVQWLSPAFPTGGYAYSHGLEAVIFDGERSAAGIGAWIEGVLRHGSGQSDAVLLSVCCGVMIPQKWTQSPARWPARKNG
jgi:urease accessory protein UreF